MKTAKRTSACLKAVLMLYVILAWTKESGAVPATTAPDALPAKHAKSQAGSNIGKLTIQINTTGVAKTTQKEVRTKQPFDPGDQIIHLNGEPEHLVLRFDNEKVDYDSSYELRHLVIYPLQQYRSIFPAEQRKAFDKEIDQLKKIIGAKSVKGADEIPILPDCDAHQMFHHQERYLTFRQGSGISFLSEYSNSDPPPSNEGLFYTFQGLTADGKYYVSFFFPVRAEGLPKEKTEDYAQQQAQAKKADEYLRQLPHSKFTPSLDAIDRMIESINLK